MTLTAFESKLLKLSLKERSRLAAKLIASLDEVDPKEAEEMWADEGERRHRELLAGRVKLIPAKTVMKRVKKAFKR